MARQPYSYVVLRYRHDPLAGELVNVGVVLHAPENNFLAARMRKTVGRLSKLYPDLEAATLTGELRRIESAATSLAGRERRLAATLDFTTVKPTAISLAQLIVDDPAGTFLWGEEGTGITNDPDKTLTHLFTRFVAKYDLDQQVKRSDADVWKAVRDALAARDVASRFESRTIRSDIDEVQFDHAWRNGVWHVLQPLSFDLADAESIRTKAAKWVGHMHGLRRSRELFKPYFIVGKPSEGSLEESFEKAVSFLAGAPSAEGLRVVRESEVPQLVQEIGKEIDAHEAVQGGVLP